MWLYSVIRSLELFKFLHSFREMLFPSIDNVGPMPFHLHNLILLLHGCKLKGSQDLSVIYLSLFEYFPFKVGPFFYTSTCISFHINILGAFVHSCCHALLTWTVTWLDLGVNGPPNLKKKKIYIYIYVLILTILF